MPEITITKIEPKGEKVCVVTFSRETANGNGVGTAKAWKNDVSSWSEGLKVDADFYDRKAYNSEEMEKWVRPVKPQGGGNRSGGQAKSDPVKNALINQANANNIAEGCCQMAVKLLGDGWLRSDEGREKGINEVRNLALELSSVVKEVAQIIKGAN